MKIAVTGATGFVGSSLVRALAAQGAEITALVRPASDRSRLSALPLKWVEGDVTEPDSLTALLAGVDGLIHAAGMLGQAGVSEEAYQRLHVTGTRHVLTAAAAAGLKRILYVSSPGVLGPIDGEPADETAPPAPSNPYERSKAAAEAAALEFAADGLPVTIVRPEFIYGPGDTHVLGLFQAVRQGRFFYIGHGRYTCHPTYIDDAVQGMLLCFQAGRAGEIYHVTGPRPVTFRELGQSIAGALGVRPPWLAIPRQLAWLGAAALEVVGKFTGLTPPLSRTGVAFFSENRRFSWRKVADDLGYQPQVELDDGVRRTVAWYRTEGFL